MTQTTLGAYLTGAALACVAASCSASPKVTLAAAGSPPAGSFTPGLATLPVGIVLGFEAHVDSTTAVTATADDLSVVTVAPTIQGSQFVLIGLTAGQTTLRVYANGLEQASLTVLVTAPPP